MCTLLHAQRALQLNLPQHDSFGLGVSAVAMVITPPKLSKIDIFAHLCSPRHFVYTFSHASNDSHLTSAHILSSSLGMSAVAMVTTPPNLSKNGVFAHLCPPRHFVHTFTYLRQFTFEFDTHS